MDHINLEQYKLILQWTRTATTGLHLGIWSGDLNDVAEHCALERQTCPELRLIPRM